jgi:hypothetical protein
MVKISIKKEQTKPKRVTRKTKQKQKQKQTQKVIVNISKDTIKRKRALTKSTLQKKQATPTPTINVPQGLPTNKQDESLNRLLTYLKERDAQKVATPAEPKNNELETDKKEEEKTPIIETVENTPVETITPIAEEKKRIPIVNPFEPTPNTLSTPLNKVMKAMINPKSYTNFFSSSTPKTLETLVQRADETGENPITGLVSLVNPLSEQRSTLDLTFPRRTTAPPFLVSPRRTTTALNTPIITPTIDTIIQPTPTPQPEPEPVIEPVIEPDEDELINVIPQADMEQYKTYTTQVNQAEQTFGTQTNEQPLTEYLSNMQQGPALETIDPNAEIEEEVVQVENRGAAAAADDPSNKAPPEEDKYKGWSKRRLIEFLQSNGLNTYKIYKDGTTYPKITLAELKAYVKDHDHS